MPETYGQPGNNQQGKTPAPAPGDIRAGRTPELSLDCSLQDVDTGLGAD